MKKDKKYDRSANEERRLMGEIIASNCLAISGDFLDRCLKRGLTAEMFTDVNLRTLFREILDYREKSSKFDPEELINHLRRSECVVGEDTEKYIGKLMADAAVGLGDYWLQCVLNNDLERRIDAEFMRYQDEIRGDIKTVPISVGKTSLGMNIACNVAEKGKKVLVFSCEMSRKELINRMIRTYAKVDTRQFAEPTNTALDDKVPVIAMSQLSRASAQRTGAEASPRLTDLRDSGAIEQDADIVILLDRPLMSKGNMCLEFERDIAYVNVAKNRNGEIGECIMRFNGAFTAFEEVSPDAKQFINNNRHHPGSIAALPARNRDQDVRVKKSVEMLNALNSLP